MKINFKNKNILITGCSRGIGKSLYEKFKALEGNVIGTTTSYNINKGNENR